MRRVDAAHLLISATHTHQAPGGIFPAQGYALLGGDEFDPRVFEAVVGGITRAVQRADATLTPAKLGWAQTELDGANNNRRRDNQWCLNPEVRCDAAGNWTGKGVPPNNRTLTVIRLDTVAGTPIGVITNFANHGTIGGDDNLLFSGDNQAYAVRQVEAGIRSLAGTSLDSAAVANGWPVDALVNGAQGDQSPASDAGAGWPGARGVLGSYAEMEGAGHRQAPATLDLWQSLASRMRTNISLDARFEQLCFCGQAVSQPGTNYDNDPLWDHVAAAPMLGGGGITLDDGTASPTVVPTQGKKIGLAAPGSSPQVVRLQSFRIGDLVVATVPGEPTVQVGRRLISRVRAAAGPAVRGVIVAGLADDYVSYFTTQEEYRAYAYEGSFSLYGPQEGELVIEQQASLAAAMAAGAPVPVCANDQRCPAPLSGPSLAGVSPTASAVVPDAAAAVVTQPVSSAARFATVRFSWTGGSPSAEWAPDLDRVRVEFRTPQGWTVVAGDARDTQTLLTYEHTPGTHTWTAHWEVPLDAAVGTYRLHALGHRGTGGGTTAAYDLRSSPVVVSRSRALTTSVAGAVVKVWYPTADVTSNFRYRPGSPSAGTVTAIVDGARVTAPIAADGTATFAGNVTRVINAVDQYGNRTA